MNKRYAIVRADKFCPRALERNYNLKCIGSLHCDKCDLRKKYGDTKEQLIRKVAQALERTIIDGIYVRFGKPITVEKLATDVIEFLGVE